MRSPFRRSCVGGPPRSTGNQCRIARHALVRDPFRHRVADKGEIMQTECGQIVGNLH